MPRALHAEVDGATDPRDRARVVSAAKIKMADLNANDLNAASLIIAGTARSMGVLVDGL